MFHRICTVDQDRSPKVIRSVVERHGCSDIRCSQAPSRVSTRIDISSIVSAIPLASVARKEAVLWRKNNTTDCGDTRQIVFCTKTNAALRAISFKSM